MLLKKIKNNARWTYVISDFNGEEIIEKGSQKKVEKQKTSLGIKNWLREKMINYTSDRKFMIIYLIYKMSYFPEPYTCSRNKIKVKLHFSTYVTKSHLKTQQELIHQILLNRLI